MFFTASRSKRAIVAIGFAGLISAFVSSNASAGQFGGDLLAGAAPLNGAGTTFGLGSSGRIGSGLIQPITSTLDAAMPMFVAYELKKEVETGRAFEASAIPGSNASAGHFGGDLFAGAAPVNGAGTTFGLGGSGRIGSGLIQPITSALDVATPMFVTYELKKDVETDRAFAASAIPGSNASAGHFGGGMFAGAAPINGAGTTFGLGGFTRIASGPIQPITSALDVATPMFVTYELKKDVETDRAFAPFAVSGS